MTLRSRPSLPVAGLTVLLMTLLALTLIAGCGGSSGPSPAELAAQDKKVEAANRGAATYARVVAVAQRLKRRRERHGHEPRWGDIGSDCFCNPGANRANLDAAFAGRRSAAGT